MAAPIHVANQRKADLEREIDGLKAEGRKLLDIVAKDRTPEQSARLDAIEKDVDAKAGELSATLTEIARLEKFQATERKEAEKHAPTLEVGKDRALDRKATFGEVLQAMAYQQYMAQGRGDRAAFVLPNGVGAHVIDAIGGPDALRATVSGASSGTPESGGLLVRNDWNTSLLNRVQETGKIAPRCFPMPVGEGFDGVEAPFVDETSRATGSRWGGVQVYRGAEAAAMTAAQPKLALWSLRLEDMFGLFYATDRVLRDATLLESLASTAFTSEFAFKLDDEIVRGTGAGQCLGILTTTGVPTVSVAKETGQAAGTIVSENIEKMYTALLARCTAGARWYINQTCWPQLFKLSKVVGVGGVPVFLPPGGLSASPYGMLMGLPIDVIEQASAVGTVGDIILANFSNDYALISKPMTSASSIHVLFTSNQTTFRWVWPVIGKPTMSASITPYKGSGSFGPFVTLATRA